MTVLLRTCARVFLVVAGVQVAAFASEQPAPRRVLQVSAAGASVGASQPYRTIALGLAAARDGDEIRIAPGDYREGGVLAANRVTIRAERGAVVRGGAVEGKAVLVIRGNDTTVSGLECTDVAVPDQNGACIRLEGRNLKLSGVNFHDSEEGVLTSPEPGVVSIEDSVFHRLGRAGQAHGLYIGGGELHISRSRFLASRDEGHEIKSRARVTRISDSLIASLDGDSSRAIDLPNGGFVTIENCVIAHGPRAMNQDLVGFGLEGSAHPGSRLAVRSNVLLLERRGGNVVVHAARGAGEVSIAGNLIIGRGLPGELRPCNRVLASAEQAGFRSLGDLPDPTKPGAIRAALERWGIAIPAGCR